MRSVRTKPRRKLLMRTTVKLKRVSSCIEPPVRSSKAQSACRVLSICSELITTHPCLTDVRPWPVPRPNVAATACTASHDMCGTSCAGRTQLRYCCPVFWAYHSGASCLFRQHGYVRQQFGLYATTQLQVSYMWIQVPNGGIRVPHPTVGSKVSVLTTGLLTIINYLYA